MAIAIAKNPLDYNKDVNYHSFNCGGFAMQTLDWYMPETWQDNSYRKIDEADLEDVYYDTFEELLNFSKEVLEDNVEEISCTEVDNIPLGVEIVGFRFETWDDEEDKYQIGDFHFIFRDSEGKWWHKPGSSEVREFFGDPTGDWDCGIDYNYGEKFFVRVA